MILPAHSGRDHLLPSYCNASVCRLYLCVLGGGWGSLRASGQAAGAEVEAGRGPPSAALTAVAKASLFRLKSSRRCRSSPRSAGPGPPESNQSCDLPRSIPGCACERLDAPGGHQEDVEVGALDFPDRLPHCLRRWFRRKGARASSVSGCAEEAPQAVEAERAELKVRRPAAVFSRAPGVVPVFRRDAAPTGEEGRTRR